MELQVNCGFARAAIRKYSNLEKGKTAAHIDKYEKAQEFQLLFGTLPTYGVDPSIFEAKKSRESLFDRYCKNIYDIITKWSKREKKLDYLSIFSPENWRKLPNLHKKRHTLGKCKECALAFCEQQRNFPGPTFNPGKTLAQSARLLAEQNHTLKLPEQTTTREILAELEPLYQNTYGHSFTDSLARCKGTGLQTRQTATEKKKTKRRIQQECRDHISEQLHKSDALTVLSEAQSLASYQRQRISQSFESPQQTHQRAQTKIINDKKHSPDIDTVEWD